MDQKQAQDLLKKSKSDQLTDQERAILESWYLDWKTDDKLDLSESELSDDLNRMRASIPFLNKRGAVRTLWPRIASVASVIFILSFGGYFLFKNKGTTPQNARYQAINIIPGSNKATITLANGQKLILNGNKKGSLAVQGNTVIDQLVNGQVVYHVNKANNKADTLAFNTLTTPRAGQYHLTLADGTNVWLNAASSIRYPTYFKGKIRQVAVTGEAYFEVAHNKAKPFRVVSNEQIIEVLGTHFNINAYNDEASIKTTLLQGSVRINAGGNVQLLKPGQQSSVSNKTIKLAAADVDEVTAWKNDYFEFTDADIQTIMRQISRWYDVDVRFEGPVTKEAFTGRISRFKNISQVLKIVQSSKSLKIIIEGRRITIRQ